MPVPPSSEASHDILYVFFKPLMQAPDLQQKWVIRWSQVSHEPMKRDNLSQGQRIIVAFYSFSLGVEGPPQVPGSICMHLPSLSANRHNSVRLERRYASRRQIFRDRRDKMANTTISGWRLMGVCLQGTLRPICSWCYLHLNIQI